MKRKGLQAPIESELTALRFRLSHRCQSVLRLRSQATNPTPMPPSIRAEGTGITGDSEAGILLGGGTSEGEFWDAWRPDDPPPHPVRITAAAIRIAKMLTNSQCVFCLFCLDTPFLSVHV